MHFTELAVAAGTFLAVDGNGLIIATTTPTASVDESSAYSWTGAHDWNTQAIFTGGIRTNELMATTTYMDAGTSTDSFYISGLFISD